MLLADATARLKMMTAWDSEPALSEDELTILLTDFKVPYYVPDSWDLDGAAAEGWRAKAGKCANRFNFSSDVNSFSRSQIYDHCIAQVKQYDHSMSTIEVRRGDQYDPVLGNVDFTND